jgi:hypothetical protein
MRFESTRAAHSVVQALPAMRGGGPRRELDDGVVVPTPLQARAQVLVYLVEGGRFGVFEGEALIRREQVAAAPFRKTRYLRLGHAALRERRGIDVDAEGALVDLRNPHHDERPQRRRQRRGPALERAVKESKGPFSTALAEQFPAAFVRPPSGLPTMSRS